jgi:hypothetical protein
MRSTSFYTVLLLICALTLAPLLPAFAQASSWHAAATAPTGDQLHSVLAGDHAHHVQAQPSQPDDRADRSCLQHDSCAGVCCATCAHCFLAALEHAMLPVSLRGLVFTAALPTDHALLVPALLERPPRLLA